MDELDKIRESRRPGLETWLARAESRRQALKDELRQLDAEIAGLRAVLGEAGPEEAELARGRMTLQDAMATVLREEGPMKPADLARRVGERDLYRMRDGRQVGAHGIQARVTNYPELFIREGGLIKLKEA